MSDRDIKAGKMYVKVRPNKKETGHERNERMEKRKVNTL